MRLALCNGSDYKESIASDWSSVFRNAYLPIRVRAPFKFFSHMSMSLSFPITFWYNARNRQAIKDSVQRLADSNIETGCNSRYSENTTRD